MTFMDALGLSNYSQATRTALIQYSGGLCYYPGCLAPLIEMRRDGKLVIVGVIVSICAFDPGNPRFDPTMTDEKRHGYPNALMLCQAHHKLVEEERPNDFSSEKLRRWKEQREANPLYVDLSLRDAYRSVISDTLHDPEIRDSFDYISVRPIQIRIELERRAMEILSTAGHIYGDYLASRDRLRDLTEELAEAIKMGRDRIFSYGVAAMVIGFVTITGSLIARLWLNVSVGLTWIGILCLIIGLIASLESKLRISDKLEKLLYRLPDVVVAYGFGVASSATRRALINAIKSDELPARTRHLINTLGEHFDCKFQVIATPGLSEAFDLAYHVPTHVAQRIDGALGRLSGASIGIAGPRGSGKSTLLRRYCDEGSDSVQPNDDLKVFVSAPVQYAPRDFVLHLFATFCRRSLPLLTLPSRRTYGRLLFRYVTAAIISYFAQVLALERIGGSVWAFEIWRSAAGLLVPLGVGVICAVHVGILFQLDELARRKSLPARLARRARRHLVQIRHLQTRTVGWSGTLKFPIGVDTGATRSRAQIEQPLSYPEIIAAFRLYAQDIAGYLQPSGRVFVGIDELDKIADGNSAQQFLNDIKGIFGLPRTYFMISVSSDAMNAFERRGLPFRDAFDSSFDEVIQVGPLPYAESVRLIRRRVIGLSEPYIAFCHCLSGGLPRDLIRVARNLVEAGSRMPDGAASLTTLCPVLLREEVRNKARAIVGSMQQEPVSGDALAWLYKLSHDLERPTKDVLRGVVSVLPEGHLLMYAAYVYFCLTLEEVFSDELAVDYVLNREKLEVFAIAQRAFSVDAVLAWRMISDARRAWSLAPWDRPV